MTGPTAKETKMRVHACLATLLLTAGPALAGGFVPPSGCTGELTIQMRGCTVANVYTCTADKPGERWTANFSADGPTNLAHTDAEYQWLQTFDTDPGTLRALEPEPADPSSLSGLFETGRDDYDFAMTGEDRDAYLGIAGFDRMTGETTEVDGEPLDKTAFAMTVRGPNGEIISKAAGTEYVSRKHRIFIAGVETRIWSDGSSETTDNSPVAIARPGETGFMASTPIYDCGVLSLGPVTLPQHPLG